jgi:hypothetical protein
MNTTQMQDRLRVELLRRIKRGSLTVSLLARQTGYGQSHMSNFLHNDKQISIEAMDRVLAAQHLSLEELMPAPGGSASEDGDSVPLVSHQAALFEHHIRPAAVQAMVHLLPGRLASFPASPSTARRTWERFVAVHVSAADAQAMDPVLLPDSIVLIDRHYNQLTQYRPDRPNLYAVNATGHLRLRYVGITTGRLVLRPHNLPSPLELIEVDESKPVADWIVGRVALILNEA